MNALWDVYQMPGRGQQPWMNRASMRRKSWKSDEGVVVHRFLNAFSN